MKYVLPVLLTASIMLLCGCSAKEAPVSTAEPLPENAALVSFAWSQTAMSADESFWFAAGKPQWNTDAEGRFLNCEFRTAEGEFVERRDALLSDEQWAELEKQIRMLSLLPYAAPDENMLDATDSQIDIAWSNGGETVKNRYAGNNADAFYDFLCEFAMQTQSTECN